MPVRFDMPAHRIIGPAGELPVLPDDLVVSRLAMLVEGQCEGIGVAAGGREVRPQQTAIFSVAQTLS